MAWVGALETGGRDALQAALGPVAEPDGADVSEPDGARALAAAEVVAALRGAPADDLPGRVQTWVAAQDRTLPDEMVTLARGAIDRVVTEPSALLVRWEAEGPDTATAWKARLANLRDRLD